MAAAPISRGTRKQRKDAARGAAVRCMQSLHAARTEEELDAAMEEAEQLRGAGADPKRWNEAVEAALRAVFERYNRRSNARSKVSASSSG